MATFDVPGPTPAGSLPKPNRKSFYLPLTSHGMPKRPRDASPTQPHRFSRMGLSTPTFILPPSSPKSPGPKSPPMSAKSFDTFIDSEPSTPAYSPRLDDGWDSSTLVLLRPMSSSSAPSSPTEPTWDMMSPTTKSAEAASHEAKTLSNGAKEISAKTSLSSHPIKSAKSTLEIKKSSKIKTTKETKDIKNTNISPKDTPALTNESVDEETNKKPSEEQEASTSAVPFGKLATRVKSILRRRAAGDKKKEKKSKEPTPELDRMEDVHWTEM